MPSPNPTSNTTQSLGVIQTVKKWFRNSWPFKTVSDEPVDSEVAAEEEEVLVHCHDDEVCSVDDCTNIVDQFDECVCGESVVEQCHDKISNNDKDKSDGNNDSGETNKDGPGGRVMDLVMASPKKYFLRSRLRKSCRFQLNHNEIVVDESGEMKVEDGFVGAKKDDQDAGKTLTRATNEAASKCDNVVADITFSSNDNTNHTEKHTTSNLPTQTTTTKSTPWTKTEITQLRQAYQQSTPTSTTLWHDIAKIMNNTHNYNRTASECQKMWFSLVATPKNKKRVAIRTRRTNNGRVSSGVEEEDDLFDSTPLKFAVCEIENGMEFVQSCCLDADAANTVENVTATTNKNKNGAATTTTKSKKQQRPPLKEQTNHNNTLQSPNNKSFHKRIKSPLQKRPRMFSPKYHNRKSLTPVMHRRKGYNTYVNNLRREINRAQKSKVVVVDDEAMNGNVQTNICVREGRGQPSAELESDGVFVLNVPEESGENDYDADLFEQVFCMHDEENEDP